ncbi:MAG: flagellar type III secretion system protein FlhB [Gemmatimonadetes bacterium]|nr:flagellar type III secretion system protein FlhB [Gemmatimonadota bacterium]
MAEDTDSGEKTEAPSDKKLGEARQRGQIAKSPEFTTATFLLGATVAIAAAGPPMRRYLVDMMGGTLATAGDQLRWGDASVLRVQELGFRTLVAIVGVGAGMAVLAIAVQAAQTGGLLTTKPLEPNWGRLNPVAGVQRLFGKQALGDLVKSLGKLLIVGWAVYSTLADAWPAMQALAADPAPDAVLEVAGSYSLRLLRNAGFLFLALAGADYAWQRRKTYDDLKMTKQEVKEEAKASEGSGEVKARMRQIGRERLRRAMFKEVPKADVVIVNPVHIAVAIKYDPAVAPAPYVVALGRRKVAERIKAIAFDAGVPVIENVPLARALIAAATVGTIIPVELYLAVAEVLAFVMRQRERYGARWAGTVTA